MKQMTEKFLTALSQDQILATIPSGLFLVDKNKIVVYWNAEAERITGYTATEAIGQHCSFLEGIECGSGCGLFDNDSAEKPIIGAECHIRTKTGEQIVITKNVDFIRIEGDIVGGVESFVDITSQKELESTLRNHSSELEETVRIRTAALEEERSRLRSVLDSMTDLAYIVNDSFQIDFLNKSMAKVFGPSIGKICYEVIHGYHQACDNCPWGQIKEGQSVNEERQFGNSGRTYEIIHTPVHTPQGELQKLAVCRDITERKEAAEKLVELNKQLDSFVYTVSHDLRSPLTPIIGFAEFLREEYKDRLDDQGIELLQEIENQGGRMLNLMEDLLNLSRVGHLPPPEQPVKVDAVVQSVLLDNQAEIKAKKVTVTTDNLPDLMIPETLLYELISNLVLNAVRYGCSPNGVIEINGRSSNLSTSLEVVDHGPGIPENERDRVCNVFFRGSTAGKIPGTGIGLATVHKIVRLYNGTLKLEQTPEGGCTVHIHFPAD